MHSAYRKDLLIMPPETNNYLYNDIIVVEGGSEEEEGKPIKSFSCYEDVDGMIQLGKTFIQDRKISALKNGDNLPVLRLGRICVDLNTPYPHRAWVDFNFQKSQLGNSPTPNPKARGG